MPSVCESTACNTSRLRMAMILPSRSAPTQGAFVPDRSSREAERDGLLSRAAYRLLLLCGQRSARSTAGPAVPSDEVHRQLDGLDELGPRVPAQQRVQQPVERESALKVSGDGGAVQLDGG